MNQSSNAHGLVATFGGAALTALTYAQVVISIIAGIFTCAAAIYTMWPGIREFLHSKGRIK